MNQDTNGSSPRQNNVTQQLVFGEYGNQDTNGYSPRDKNNQYITNFNSNMAINDYNHINQMSHYQQTSQNHLFFSPRSEVQILNGNPHSETYFQNSIRDVSIQDHTGREDDYLNQLLNQTQIHQLNISKSPYDVFSPTSHQQINQQQQNINETDEKGAQNSNSNNYRNLDSFSMSNSLLSPELRRPFNKGAKNVLQYQEQQINKQNINQFFYQILKRNNLSNIEDSYNQMNVNIKNYNGKQTDMNGSMQRQLLKLQAPPNLLSRKSMKRKQNKNLTNINVDEYDENEEEEEEDDEQKQEQNNDLNTHNKAQSLKDVGSQNYGNDGDQFAFQNNNSDDSEDLKKKQRDIIRDDSSVRSGESQFYSKKVNIFDIIINKREPQEMFYIKAIGFLSFLILMTLTFVLFFQLKINFDVVWENFSNLKIGPSALEQYSQVLRNYEMTYTPFVVMCMTQIQMFPNELRIALQKEGIESQNNFQNSINHIDSELFAQSQFQGYFYDGETTLMLLSQKNQDANTFVYLNATRGQSLNLLPYYLKFYYLPTTKYLDPRNCYFLKSLNDIYSQAFTYQNYNTYIESLIQISTISQENANEKLSSTKSLLIFSVILVEVISSIIVLVIFPVHYIIIGRKEEILKLICTFNSELISNQITRYRQAQHNKIFIQDDVDKLLAIKRQHSMAGASSTNQNSMRFLPNPTEKKKRTISQTNNLNRFSFKLTFRTFCIFLILSLNPILNILLMRGFFENFKYNIEEYSMIYQTKAYVSLNYLTTYLLVNFPIYGFGEENRNKLYYFLDVLEQDGKDRLQSFYEMDKNFQSDRYQIDEYKSIFLDTLKQDACKVLVDNQNTDFVFNQLVVPDQCTNVLQGKLKKGIILGIREIYDKLYSLQDLIKATFKNLQIYIPGYIKWTFENNLKDLDTGYYYLRDIIDLLARFIENSSREYFDYLTTVQLILFIESIVVISVIFLIIGTRFIKSLGSTIYNTTFLFTLLPIDSLIENPYVFNYLSNERRRNKGK